MVRPAGARAGSSDGDWGWSRGARVEMARAPARPRAGRREAVSPKVYSLLKV